MNLAEGAVSFRELEIDVSDDTKVSDAIQFEDGVYPVGIFHPILSSSVALVFQVSTDGVTWVDMFDAAGVAVTVVVAPAAAGYTILSPSVFAGVKHMKIEVADVQAADRIFKIAVRGV